ncbi:MAG: guanine deaminase [Oligoflexia bacterium]|nr:guanine deaminase [Oligoflexia bacterium]
MIVLHRAQWLFDAPSPDMLRYFEKGALAIDDEGEILDFGPFTTLRKLYPKAKVFDHGPHSVITPGFIDCHVHAPQMEMMASAGYSLLEWLNNHTFPVEAKYANATYATKRWKEFCNGLLSCGTTYAAIYATSHTPATLKLMEVAEKSGLRAHVGKVLMDRNAPENLLQPADEALIELEGLIKKWKKTERVKPAITVRFAPTSTNELLEGVSQLRKEHPHLLVQTHLGETPEEIKWVADLFPKSKNYTDVYAQHGLIDDKSLLGHCIYLKNEEVNILKRQKSHLVHCPSSNFFLGSGLFPYQKMRNQGLSIALGSDVGGGWDLSMHSTARCCYEAQALQKYFMKPSELLYLATRAGALALGDGDRLGVFEKNYIADFVVHDLKGRSLVADRVKQCDSPDDLLSALLFLGGEPTVRATYIQGKCRYESK